MKHTKFGILGVIAAVFTLLAVQANAQMVDSTAYVSIVDRLNNHNSPEYGRVKVNQSSSISSLIEEHSLANQKNQSMQGWRIRIYNDNSQNARSVSEYVVEDFRSRYPDVGAYRSYRNPYFTVVVGDFRTADDAEKFLRTLKSDYRDYSKAWIVEDKIYFPSL